MAPDPRLRHPLFRGLALALAGTLGVPALPAAPPAPPPPLAEAGSPLAALEAQVGGRLGVAALDTGTGRRLEHRSGEAFPLCSTFKVLLAGAVLARVERGEERLDRVVRFGPDALLEYAPVARAAGGRLTIAELCAATVEVSDNTAANLLLGTLGGPQGLTTFLRGLGDATTRLDRLEPDLNEAAPGDPRDTTTPMAMVGSLKALLLGEALSPASRQRLEAWMRAATTGRTKLRAHLPPGWTAGDKSGSGGRGTLNDVAIFRPPGRAPILVAAYLTGSSASAEDRNAVLAEVGRLVADRLGRPEAP